MTQAESSAKICPIMSAGLPVSEEFIKCRSSSCAAWKWTKTTEIEAISIGEEQRDVDGWRKCIGNPWAVERDMPEEDWEGECMMMNNNMEARSE